jgi:WD40 repeat protein/class 3 adenylate cyclase
MTEVEEEGTTQEGGEGEAVVRTFLIVDVRGYTRFTRERGDAEAARLARRFAELARDAAEARGGTVIELRGDEALAVFVSPRQALRAGVELVAACEEEVAEDPSLPLLVGVGIDMGPAVRVEGGFRGMALNMAARLSSEAAAGQVLLRDRLAEVVGDMPGIQLARRGSAELKGFEGLVGIVEATMPKRGGPVESPPDDRREQGGARLPPELELEAELVGRERELAWLRGTWRQARRGDGRVVFVSGPPGIGKTRLALELVAAARAEGAELAYVSAGGAAQALALTALEGAASASAPMLVVLDDLDALAEPLAAVLAEAWSGIERAPALVVGLFRDADAVPALDAVVERADVDGDGHRALAPLDEAGLRLIARSYAGDDVSGVPLESIGRASGGVPGRIHELLSEWAEAEASRRLAAAAEWLAAERLDRRADLEFANNVISLKLARLYRGDGAAADAATDACPYKGLASFEEEDARFFFGRERLVGELAARTVGVGLLAVIGASGSGKSSVIAAGLLPSLRAGLLPGSERWQSVVVRPGDRPAAVLEAALMSQLGSGERLVLVIDQFEEVFTRCEDETKRQAFVDRLTELAADPEQVVVVAALRADFYGRCGSYPELARLLAANQVLVGPMSDPELRRAVELPARRLGVRVEAALVDALVAEVADEPGSLPLLSTALVELWGEQSGGWLRLEAHARLGGVRGAVARLAEGSYEQFGDADRVACQTLLLRLVSTGEQGAPVRRTVYRSELDLDQDPVLGNVVERLTRDRLLTATDDAVEVAHEALLREWPRFEEWLREDEQGRELREHLTQSAKRWDAAGRDAAELYRGARLAATDEWATTRQHELNQLERTFLAESRQHAELEAERQRRVNRRLRGLLAGVGVLLAAALAAGGFVLVLRGDAQHSATSAEAQRLGAQALVQNDLDLSLLLAREGVHLSDSAATRSNLLAALLRSPYAISIMRRPTPGRILQISSGANGDLLVGYNRGPFELIDPTTRHVLRRFPTSFGELAGLSADGRHVGLLFGNGSVRFVDVRTGSTVHAKGMLTGASVQAPSAVPVFSPDLHLLAVGVAAPASTPPSMLVYRTLPVRLVADLPAPAGAQPYLWQAFSPDNRYLFAGGNKIVSVWRIGSRTPVLTLHVPGSIAALSHNDRLLAVGDEDGTLHLYSFPSGKPKTLAARHNAFVDGIGFSPDDKTLVSTGDDAQVLVTDVATGTLRETLTGHRDRVYGPAFSPDGRTVYTGGFDGSVIGWDLAGSRSLGRSDQVDSGANPLASQLVAASPDGRLLAFNQIDGKVLLRDARSLRLLHVLRPGRGGANVAVFSPNSRLLATETHLGGIMPGSCKGPRVDLWNAGSGRLIATLPVPRAPAQDGGLCADLEGLAFSPDGKLLAGGDDAPVTYLWNLTSRRVVATLPSRSNEFSVAFSPDGSELAVATGAVADVWRVSDRRKLFSVNVDDGFGSSRALAFSPDGRLLATGGGDGYIKLWDARDGRLVLRSPEPVQCALRRLEFSSDGRTLLEAGCNDARLFDVSTLGEIGTPFPGPANIQAIDAAFADQGSRVVVAYATGQAIVWDDVFTDWERHACTVAGRNLSPQEWHFFLPGRPLAAVCQTTRG